MSGMRNRQWEAAERGTKQEDTPEATDRSGREPAETQDQYPSLADIVPEGTRKFDGYVSQDALDNKRWRFEFDPAVHLNTDDLDLIFQEEEERDKSRNHRTYMGSDSDIAD